MVSTLTPRPVPLAGPAAARAGPSVARDEATPWASLLLSIFAAALSLIPHLALWTSLERAAVEAGELWRLLTGHFTHWSLEHLGWDLLVFAAVGMALERTAGRRHFLLCTMLSALVISLGVWFLLPGLTEYRGLSGIDCALVTALAVILLQRALRAGRRGFALIVTAVLAAYVLKVAFELICGQTVFVDIESSAFVPVPLAHLVGGVVGVISSLARRL